jgi:hypothetical protein
MRRSVITVVAAALSIPLAVVLLLLAVDVLRLPYEFSTRDSRFEGAPARQKGLWDGLSYLPGEPAARLLEIEDDLDYRRAAGLYLRAEPGKISYEGFPELESLRAKAQFELTRLSQEDPDPKRRAQLLVLFGVMTLDTRTVSAEERENIVGRAADAFRAALELDPDNADAKHNLEMVLSIHGPIALPGNAPSQGRSEGDVSGQGSTGGGY